MAESIRKAPRGLSVLSAPIDKEKLDNATHLKKARVELDGRRLHEGDSAPTVTVLTSSDVALNGIQSMQHNNDAVASHGISPSELKFVEGVDKLRNCVLQVRRSVVLQANIRRYQ